MSLPKSWLGWYESVPMLKEGLQAQLYTSMQIRPYWRSVPIELRELLLEAAAKLDGSIPFGQEDFRTRKL